jgi:hypothetical protein
MNNPHFERTVKEALGAQAIEIVRLRTLASLQAIEIARLKSELERKGGAACQ